MPIAPACVDVIRGKKRIPITIRDHCVGKLITSKVISPYSLTSSFGVLSAILERDCKRKTSMVRIGKGRDGYTRI